MKRLTLCAVAAVAIAGSTLVFKISAAPAEKAKPAAAPDFPLPPGWTAEEVQKCMAATVPGEMHKFLAEGTGEWHGKTSMWMYPGAEPITSDSSSKVTPMLDGRFVKCEMNVDYPMGAFNGFGLYGYDNVSKRFTSTWIDNMSTGMMNGTGELSADGKTLTWKYEMNCPLTGKPTPLREIETITGKNTKTLEMFSIDPKTNKEFQMLKIELTRK